MTNCSACSHSAGAIGDRRGADRRDSSTGKANTHLKIRSPISGHVIKKYVREGQYVEEGTPLYDVADSRPSGFRPRFMKTTGVSSAGRQAESSRSWKRTT